jgi:hypothetical protein
LREAVSKIHDGSGIGCVNRQIIVSRVERWRLLRGTATIFQGPVCGYEELLGSMLPVSSMTPLGATRGERRDAQMHRKKIAIATHPQKLAARDR